MTRQAQQAARMDHYDAVFDLIDRAGSRYAQQYQTVILDTPAKVAEHSARDGQTYRLGDTVHIPLPASFAPMDV